MPETEKPIEKKTLHSGRPGSQPRDFREGTKVKFHFAAKLGEKTLDDSRKWDNKKDGPMEIVFGKKFKLECWETCLSTMVEGEVASFKCRKKVKR